MATNGVLRSISLYGIAAPKEVKFLCTLSLYFLGGVILPDGERERQRPSPMLSTDKI